MADAENKDLSKISALMQLEAMARNADSIKALQFLIVNETRRLISFRQAFVFSIGTRHTDIYRLRAASSLSIVERDAPFVRWLEKLLSKLHHDGGLDKVRQIDVAQCPEKMKDGWGEYSLPFVLWCPLTLPDGSHIGGIWLARETPWKDNETLLIKRLAETYAHAWYALSNRESLDKTTYYEKIAALTILFIVVSFLLIPIRISSIAPVEVIAKDPMIVSAPMDGVIREVLVPPNTYVKSGAPLFMYEDTTLRNRYNIADKTLAVAFAEFRQATQESFRDPKSKAKAALLKASYELSQAEKDYAFELLKQVEVKASTDGLLIYSDVSDLSGRFVRVGEQIMQIADTSKIKLRINLPVDDAIVLTEGAEVKIFLDVDPLNSIPAIVTRTSYEATLTPDDILAYQVDAVFKESGQTPRIGLQGTAKIYGQRMSLFLYLFRRPIASMRQYIGI